MSWKSVGNYDGTRTNSFRRRARCPHCWSDFATEDVLWIAESIDLLGDSRLGESFKERFLPIQFDANGAAIDRAGFSCRKLACPNCHLTIPRSYLETTPFFFSVAGAPSSGKTCFLTSAIWRLRRVFSEAFDVIFNDSDPDLNSRLIENETSQFLRRDGETIPKLQKTRELGDEYDSVSINGQETRFLKPFLFSAYLKGDAPGARKGGSEAATVALYDNAGESFLPAAGVDDASAPVTRHLGRSDALIFIYDPTQDARFSPAKPRGASQRNRQNLADGSIDPTDQNELKSDSASLSVDLADAFGFSASDDALERRNAGAYSEVLPLSNVRQELVFAETLKRARENLGFDFRAKFEKPLIVVLSKFDVWRDALDDVSLRDPWARTSKGTPFFLLDRVRDVSTATRRLTKRYLPELVAQAEDFARDVVYIPTSATGESPFFDEKTREWRFDAANYRPLWTEVPILYALAKARSGLVSPTKTS